MVKIDVEMVGGRLRISTDNNVIGTQGDVRAAKFIWSKPERFRGHITKLLFESDLSRFKPVYIQDNEFDIVQPLTRGTRLTLCMGFVDQEKRETVHSNTLTLRLRENPGWEEVIPGGLEGFGCEIPAATDEDVENMLDDILAD